MKRPTKTETKQAPGPTENKGAPIADAAEQDTQTPESAEPTATENTKKPRTFGFLRIPKES